MKKNCWSFCIVLFLSLQASSQISKAKDEEKESYFKADLNYLNDLVYLGRRDSIAVPYLTATIGYYHKSGFYLTGALS